MPKISLKQMIQFLNFLENENCWFFDLGNASVFFNRDKNESLVEDLNYYIEHDLIEYVGCEVYAFRIFSLVPFNSQELLAHALRPFCLNYISFEYMLNQYSIISQIPTIITLATKGEAGAYHSKSYSIRFEHVDHDWNKIVDNTLWSPAREILLASPLLALEDLQKTGRHQDLIVEEEIEDAVDYFENHQRKEVEEYLKSLREDGKESQLPHLIKGYIF